MTLNVAFCFALLLGLAVVTQAQAEDYYIYQTPNGELVISNKEPPPGSEIINQLPGVTDREVQQAQEPGKPQQCPDRRLTEAVQKQIERVQPELTKPVANCIPGPNLRRLFVGRNVERESLLAGHLGASSGSP